MQKPNWWPECPYNSILYPDEHRGWKRAEQDIWDKWQQHTKDMMSFESKRGEVMKRTGCEWMQCKHYVDGKCTDTSDYVNRDTGEDMCPLNDNAVPRKEYDEQGVDAVCKRCVYLNDKGNCWARKAAAIYGAVGCAFRAEYEPDEGFELDNFSFNAAME